MVLNNQRVIEEIKKETNKRNTWRQKQKHKGPESVECRKSISQRGVYRNTSLHQETKIPKALT